MKTKPKKSGGKRVGSGRKPKYSEETKTISFRIPESHVDEFKEMTNKFLDKLRK